jgi:2-amino-4-hydroxy-6-hydroxymethyldihydropteridine diphosphokinase
MLAEAKNSIRKGIGTITRQSSIYETAAWGNEQQDDFLNQVIIVETNLDAHSALDNILEIENKLGRKRSVKNAPRTIDIDILFFNKALLNEENLKIPHPEIQNRRFVLVPLHELSPRFKHPILQKTVHQLLKECTDNLDVNKF